MSTPSVFSWVRGNESRGALSIENDPHSDQIRLTGRSVKNTTDDILHAVAVGLSLNYIVVLDMGSEICLKPAPSIQRVAERREESGLKAPDRMIR